MEQEKKAPYWEKMVTTNVLGIIALIGCFAFLFTLLFVEIPQNNLQMVSIFGGAMFLTVLGGVTYYFFNYKSPRNTDVNTDTKDYKMEIGEDICSICNKDINL